MFLAKIWPTPYPDCHAKKTYFAALKFIKKELKIIEKEIQLFKFTNSDEHVQAFNQI